ncbi:MAG: PEP-CTERM sorting domain-containing protein [Isosphaeraceae bacterium]|nr:PEP-CTERM sorting domain-containing protein [Isosphaeraceae bacterium]
MLTPAGPRVFTLGLVRNRLKVAPPSKECVMLWNRLGSAVLGLVVALTAAGSASAGITLYDQNFENPTGFVNEGGDINISRTVNQLYGNQPVGFTFAQAFTVETLLINGTQAFGTGYSDPQAIGGKYALGLLSTRQDDLLGLSFNLQGNDFLNFRLNISSIDLDRFGGSFNPANGSAVPVFEIKLFDNPGGGTSLSGNGTELASTQITGVASASRSVFNWTEHIVALDAKNSTNGNVTLRIDLLDTGGSGYAAMDNFLIVASNTPGDVNLVPEPSTLASLTLALGLTALTAVRTRTRRPTN